MELFDSLRFKIVRRGIKIVFPEATDARILGAAARLKAEELVERRRNKKCSACQRNQNI